jgi:V/A-type H+-transporting ATPase subunit F
MKFYVIADENTVTAFKLVGLEGEAVESPEGAREALAKAFESSETGIVIITERIADTIRDEIEDFIFGRTFPLIIEIPDREGPVEGRISIREMVNSAVGVKI